MNYIKMSPLTGMVGYGGGGTGLTLNNPAAAKWYGDRGIAAGGIRPWQADANRNKKVIEYVNIANPGNSSDFGDLAEGGGYGGGLSDAVRGVFFHGEQSAQIDYITIANTGNASDFGDTTQRRHYMTGCSDGLRGIWIAGNYDGSYRDNIDYVTIASTGNATDFGDAHDTNRFHTSVSNGIRGIYGGGQKGGDAAYINDISYVTIQSAGNAQDFGDLTDTFSEQCGGGNTERAVFMGGRETTVWNTVNIIDYFAMATLGNAQDFGDLDQPMKNGQQGAVGNDTRALVLGGEDETTANQAQSTKIQYVTVQTTGNATDFGDLLMKDRGKQGCAGD